MSWLLWLLLGAGPATSEYTPLEGPKCPKNRCPGVGGYSLVTTYDDQRMSVTVVSPDKKEHPLDFQETVTGKFCHLGAKAEWIGSTALIIRVTEGGEPPNASYLSVTKLTQKEICVVAKVPAEAKDANVKARLVAGDAATMPCLGKK